MTILKTSFNKHTDFWSHYSFDDEPYLADALAFNMISLAQFMFESSIQKMEGSFHVGNSGGCSVEGITITSNDLHSFVDLTLKMPMLLNVGWDSDVGIQRAEMTVEEAFTEVGALILAKNKSRFGDYKVSFDRWKNFEITPGVSPA